MKKRFFLTGLLTTIVNLLLHTMAYFLILKDFFRSHPAGPEEFIKQLHRPPDQLIPWAMAATSLLMGFFITIVMKWSGARTFISGLRKASVMGFLFWGSVNFGLYASSNYFSAGSTFIDLACSGTVMTISGAIAAWALGSGKESRGAKTT
jgi:hypothetical protein